MNYQNNYCVMVCTHRQQLGDDAIINLQRIKVPALRIDGTNAPSCSYIWNQAIIKCPTDVVIICNEKARPEREHVDKTISLLEEGHGLVGLYRYGFFGFHKDLIRCIGWFDERFVGGWREDNDFTCRLYEADISYWEEETVPYIEMPSAWHHKVTVAHYRAKWKWDNGPVRCLLEESYSEYDAVFGNQGPWGEMPGRFLPWDAGHKIKNSKSGIKVRVR